MVMKLLIRFTSPADLSGHAYVEVTPELIEEIKNTRKFLLQLQEKNARAYCIQVWGQGVTWFESVGILDAVKPESDPDSDIIEVNRKPSAKPISMSCNLLVVTKDDFFWQANLKYSGTAVETVALRIKDYT